VEINFQKYPSILLGQSAINIKVYRSSQEIGSIFDEIPEKGAQLRMLQT